MEKNILPPDFQTDDEKGGGGGGSLDDPVIEFVKTYSWEIQTLHVEKSKK